MEDGYRIAVYRGADLLVRLWGGVVSPISINRELMTLAIPVLCVPEDSAKSALTQKAFTGMLFARSDVGDVLPLSV